MASLNRLSNTHTKEKAKQRRRDISDLKNAGVWQDPRDKYLTKTGSLKPYMEILTWFLNIYKAWGKGAANRDNWNRWCNSRVEHTGIDPREQKRKVGRPKLPQHLKKSPTKVKRSDTMKALLLEHNIHLTEPSNVYADRFLVEYSHWQFLPNGRVRHKQESPISVHQFLKNLDTK